MFLFISGGVDRNNENANHETQNGHGAVVCEWDPDRGQNLAPGLDQSHGHDLDLGLDPGPDPGLGPGLGLEVAVAEVVEVTAVPAHDKENWTTKNLDFLMHSEFYIFLVSNFLNIV